MPQNTLYLVGFGSQGTAWAQCLRKSGWDVRVYLSRSAASFHRAKDLGFEPKLLTELPLDLQEGHQEKWIAMLCPDSEIAPLYSEFLAPLQKDLRLILAHGFSIYTGDLKLASAQHQAALLAPKAIGPKIWENFEKSFPHTHGLRAAFCPPSSHSETTLEKIARDMGFSRESLIPATFQQETLGDLISEQGLLCGAVFNFLEWTLESMFQAGIPEALIREECLTELELVAGIIRQRGPAGAFKAISQAAQCGTIAMAQRLEESGLKENFQKQMQSIQSQEFARLFSSAEWRTQAQNFANRLSMWEERLNS